MNDGKPWKVVKDKTVDYGACTGSAGVTDKLLKEHGRNIARIINQTGKAPSPQKRGK